MFFNELFENVAQFDADILGSVQRCVEVEIVNVKSDTLGAFMGKEDVDQKLDEVEGSSLGSDIAGIIDVLSCNSDASAIGIRLLGTKITNNL